jgi:hypothetical protein
MHMRVKLEFLIPGVQYAEETNLRPEVFRIASDFEESLRAGSEQEIVDDLLILQSQRGQRTREREDHMHVRCRKKFPATLFQPTIARPRLTLWAVPIAATIERDGTMPAASALIEMAAECGGATPHNGQQHFDVLPGDPLAASFDKCVSRGADEIGHLERWPAHLLFLR